MRQTWAAPGGEQRGRARRLLPVRRVWPRLVARQERANRQTERRHDPLEGEL